MDGECLVQVCRFTVVYSVCIGHSADQQMVRLTRKFYEPKVGVPICFYVVYSVIMTSSGRSFGDGSLTGLFWSNYYFVFDYVVLRGGVLLKNVICVPFLIN